MRSVEGRIAVPTDMHTIISDTCDYYLLAKGLCRCTKAKDLDEYAAYPGGFSVIMWTLTSREPFLAVVRER